MSKAKKFLESLPSQDSNTVYDQLEDRAKLEGIEESQDIVNEESTWTFSDGSRIVMEGNSTWTEDIQVQADDENNAEEFWAELQATHPGVARQLESGVAVINTETWEEIKKLPGFSDGPSHAKNALIGFEI